MVHKIQINSDKHNRLWAIIDMFGGIEYQCSGTVRNENYFYFSIGQDLTPIFGDIVNTNVLMGKIEPVSMGYLNKEELYNIITNFLEYSKHSATRYDKLSELVMHIPWDDSDTAYTTNEWSRLHSKIEDNE